MGASIDSFLWRPEWTSIVVGSERLPGWKSRHRR
jgi:hypothetical protein